MHVDSLYCPDGPQSRGRAGAINAQCALASTLRTLSRNLNLVPYPSLTPTLLPSMDYKRQTHLGSTVAGDLTIIDLERPSFDAQPKHAYILQLPDELLSSIVECASEDCVTHTTWMLEHATIYDPNCVRSLSLVCQRFRRLAQPLLFRSISFEYPYQIVPPSRSVIKLHRTLSEKAELRHYCR